MLVSGVLTSAMVSVAIAAEAAPRATFGEALTCPLAEIVVRNCEALITLIGGMLIYGAFRPAVGSVLLVGGETAQGGPHRPGNAWNQVMNLDRFDRG